MSPPLTLTNSRYRRWAKSTLVLVPLFGAHYTLFLGLSYHNDHLVELIWLFCDQLFASFQVSMFVVIFEEKKFNNLLCKNWLPVLKIQNWFPFSPGLFCSFPVLLVEWRSTSGSSQSLASAEVASRCRFFSHGQPEARKILGSRTKKNRT